MIPSFAQSLLLDIQRLRGEAPFILILIIALGRRGSRAQPEWFLIISQDTRSAKWHIAALNNTVTLWCNLAQYADKCITDHQDHYILPPSPSIPFNLGRLCVSLSLKPRQLLISPFICSFLLLFWWGRGVCLSIHLKTIWRAADQIILHTSPHLIELDTFEMVEDIEHRENIWAPPNQVISGDWFLQHS